jgi:hypothetical protein
MMRRRRRVFIVAAMTLELEQPGPGITPARPAGELPAMTSVALQLHGEFPSVPLEQVSILVECLWSHYDGAPVRDFVALLVRKQAREELSDHLAPDT